MSSFGLSACDSMVQWRLAVGLVVAALSSSGIPFGLNQRTSAADAAISGVVVDGVTKQPIADAIVELSFGPRQNSGSAPLQQFTDARGRFVFSDLPACSSCTINARKSGFLESAFGAPVAGGRARVIELAEGAWFSSADIMLWRLGSISGSVTNERGEPVSGVFVRALARTRVSGRDHLAAGELVRTDDRGMYRIDTLYPGRYLIMLPSVQASAPAEQVAASDGQAGEGARVADRPLPPGDRMIDLGNARVLVGSYPVPPPANGQPFTYPITFAGGTGVSGASELTVDLGADLTGVDVQLNPVPAVRVAGVVQGPAEARAKLTLRLLAEGLEELGPGSEAGTTVVAVDGSFAFVNVPSGNYTIEAGVSQNQYRSGPVRVFYAPVLPTLLGAAPTSTVVGLVDAAPPGIAFSTTSLGTRRHWARVPVFAGPEGVSNVLVNLEPTASLRGSIVAESSDADPGLGTLARSVRLETADGDPRLGIARSSPGGNVPAGEFVVDGVLPGTYFLRCETMPWVISSVKVNGQDHTHVPIDVVGDLSGVVVTFTSAASSLSGFVRTANGALAMDAAVIVFPVEPTQWTGYGLNPVRIRTALASTAGMFRLSTLVAGTYYVLGVPGAQVNAWHEPGFFKRAQAVANRVTLGWGEQKTADVRVLEIR